ncbi:MAG: hypothetical protein D3905_03115 [Candidatus Electrothrix sp. AS4_5]|nr:hypothetical protein [Candidatus Electrothrix gigas]
MIFLYAFCFLCGIIGIYWASNESARFSVGKFNISLTEAKNVHRFFLIVFLVLYSCLLAFLGMGGYLLVSQRRTEKPQQPPVQELPVLREPVAFTPSLSSDNSSSNTLPSSPPAPQLNTIKIDIHSKQQKINEELIRQKRIIKEHVKLLDKMQSVVIKERVSSGNYTSQRSTALTDDPVQYSRNQVVTKKESEQKLNQTVIIKPTGIKRRVAKKAKRLPKTSTPSPSVRIKKKNTIRRYRTLASPKKYPRTVRKPKKHPRSTARKKSQCEKIKDSLDTRLLNYAIRKANNDMTILPNRQGVNCYITPTGMREGCITYQIEQEGNPALCFYKECTKR